MTQNYNLRVDQIKPLIPPAILVEELPTPPGTAAFVSKTRAEVSKIIKGEDDRLLCIVGPCSIHDVLAAKEYANRLVKVRKMSSFVLFAICTAFMWRAMHQSLSFSQLAVLRSRLASI